MIRCVSRMPADSLAALPHSPGPVRLPEIVSARNPELARRIPPIAYRMLNRLLHVREINGLLGRLEGVDGMPFVDAVLSDLDARIVAHGLEHLRAANRPTVISNHPLGGLDGLAMLQTVNSVHPGAVVPANDFLTAIPQMKKLMVPVNKHGSNRDRRDSLVGVFATAPALVHFPAGLCSRLEGGVLRDLPWQKSFVTMSRRFGRPVVPAYIEARNSMRFYRAAWLRKISGIRFNMEMILLPDELYRKRGSTLHIHFSRPILPHELSAMGSDHEVAELLRKSVYRIPEAPPAVSAA